MVYQCGDGMSAVQNAHALVGRCERDVGRINEKQRSRADLVGGWCVCMCSN